MGTSTPTAPRRSAAVTAQHLRNAVAELERAEQSIVDAGDAYPDADMRHVFTSTATTIRLAARMAAGMHIAADVWQERTA